MDTTTSSGPLAVIERLHQALNQHDIDAFVACFAPDYQSEQPAHPDRVFTGSDQVRKNWSSIFRDVPDIHADRLRTTVDGEMVWTEWHWTGTQAGGEPFDWRGVIIFGVPADHIAWARLYMGPTAQHGRGIDAAVRSMARPREDVSPER